jgi:hypothetical protein
MIVADGNYVGPSFKAGAQSTRCGAQDAGNALAGGNENFRPQSAKGRGELNLN